MPYKHIAAHLKKTELACRLHYHQLSHGSNRRKRTSSLISSKDGSTAQSPVMQNATSSPIGESTDLQATSPTYTYSPQAPVHVQLPSESSLLPRSVSNCPAQNLAHPVTILPKASVPRRALSDSIASARLCLDCDLATNPLTFANVDKERLHHIYETHRASFWNVIAQEYAPGASPLFLEETWKATLVSNAPPTPISPDATITTSCYQSYNSKQVMQQLPTPIQENKNSPTKISALLGIVSRFTIQ